MFSRKSGVLAHITSLPSPHGIGTMGQDARKFVDFLSEAHQTYWQVLPLGHTGFGNSPYQCYSVAAGNPLLLDLDTLVADGLLTAQEVSSCDAQGSPDMVDFDKVIETREPLLRKAFARVDAALQKKIDAFCAENADWLPDYALFMSLREHRYDGLALHEWPDRDILLRKSAALSKAKDELAAHIAFHYFVQYEFFTQWQALHEYATKKGIQIIGDLPIYVSADSADVWCHPELFCLKDDLSPKMIAGVPPDYYSATGQLWGNPVYDWKTHEKDGYAWWVWRLKSNLSLFDVLRLDHFRGFESFWQVPCTEETAIKGKWKKGPGMKLLRTFYRELGDIKLIAEDLGAQSEAVQKLLKDSGLPGMRVLIFGFTPDYDNEHLPHNYRKNSIVYTSTHDSQTVCEQVMDRCLPHERDFAYRYLRSTPNEPLGWSAIKSVWASPAVIAMTTMQDLLSLGADARMNTPGTVDQANWCWRMRRESINPQVGSALREMTHTYLRA